MKIQYRQLPLILVVIALALASCTGGAVQTSAPAADMPQATKAAASPTGEAGAYPEPGPTEAVASPTGEGEAAYPEIAPTEANAAVPETGSGVTYVIVPEESTVQYEVNETFLENNRFNTAIGTTGVINGEIQIDTANPQNSRMGTITVDISQLKSDSGRRDNAIRNRFIQTSQYPIVTFVPTGVEGLPGTYTSGQEISFKVTGDTTIRETTRPVTFDVTAKLDGETLTGTATTTILMSDFGFGPIQVAGLLGTEDEVKLTFNFVARPK